LLDQVLYEESRGNFEQKLSYDETVLWDKMQDSGTGYHRASNCTWIAGFAYFSERDQSWWLLAREAIIQVEWFGDVTPPNVKHGMQVFLMGRLLTYNLGRKVTLQDAVAIKKEGAKLRVEMAELMRRYVLSPAAYVTRERMDHERAVRKEAKARAYQRVSVSGARSVREPGKKPVVSKGLQQREASVSERPRDRLSRYEEP